MKKIDQSSIATLRALSVDMIRAANSGHPGMALGSAPILYTLFTKHLLSLAPFYRLQNQPLFQDNFILSAGHASALLYATLHLAGFNLSLDELKRFRQLHSLTPGHPEAFHTDGVMATTGPLGQGLAMAVGMALSSVHLRALFPKLPVTKTYVLVGDGCLMEGISQEAISLAGTLKLKDLIVLYDQNDVTLDGPLSNSSLEDQRLRFKAALWNVITVRDGNDVDAISRAIRQAKRSDKPTLIIVKTIIGYGSLLEGTSTVHGSPLKDDDIEQLKLKMHCSLEPFTIPPLVKTHFQSQVKKLGKRLYVTLDQSVFKEITDFKTINHDELLKELMVLQSETLISTRAASGKILNIIAHHVPALFGGSADVASSVVTNINGEKWLSRFDYAEKRIAFGIREFLMTAMQNGMLLHQGVRPYTGSFLVFSDYAKNALQLAALMRLPAL
ncbi:MAG: transketolase, partial [Erysipelotrichaceae bacterium]|nr:transketolase [Erysipelotrichaceae bacterium]